MAAQRVLWHALRQTRQSRSASPFCNGGRRRGLPFGDYAVHSPISSLAQLQHRTSIKENLLTVEETRRLLRVLSLEHLKKLIQENRKDCVSYKELLEICKRSSFSTSDEEATRIARELEETGTVLNFRGRIYLQPDQVARAIGNVMPLALPSENDPSRLELLQMTRQKAIIDQKAQKQVQIEFCIGLGFMILQTVGFFRLTFWELSWDVMEPIVFHVASFYMICGYAFSLLTSRDPTYEGWFQTRFKSKQKQLMRKNNFNLTRFNQLQSLYNPNMVRSFYPPRGLLDLVHEEDFMQRAS